MEKKRDEESELERNLVSGRFYANTGETQPAIECFEKALKIAQEILNELQEREAYFGLGHAYAIAYHEKCLEVAKTQGNEVRETLAYLGLGEAYRLNNESQTAIAYFETAFKFAEKSGLDQLKLQAKMRLKMVNEPIGEFKVFDMDVNHDEALSTTDGTAQQDGENIHIQNSEVQKGSKAVSDGSKEQAEDERCYHENNNSNEIYENINDIPAAPELNISLPALRDIKPKRVYWSIIRAELPIDLLLVTVNDHEFASCFFYLENTKRSWCDGLGMVYIGKFGKGKVKVAIIRCGKGSTEPCSSLNVLNNAARILRPKVAICVGHCGTINPAKAKLGDVVISAKLATYDGKEEPCRTKTGVSKNMGHLIPSAADGWEPPLKEPRECEINVHRDALVLTGAELVSLERRQELLKRFPEAIAIEMEGEGLYSAAHNLGIEWAILKGISYFADGNKTETGNWKSFASAMAASLVSHMFKYSDVIHQWPHYQDPAQK